MRPTRILTVSIAAFLASSIIHSTAHAADITWDIADTADIQGGTGAWDNSTTNWTSDGGVTRNVWNNVANAADTAVFSTTGGTVTLANSISLGGLKFTTPAAAYTITGGTLAFGSQQGSIDTSALAASTTTVTTISSALAGTGGLTIASYGNLASGGGTPTRLILSGDNTGLSGGIAITSGLVEFTSQNAVGSNAITLSNNAGLVHSTTAPATTALTLTNDIHIAATGGTVRNWSGVSLNLTGVLSGSGVLNITDKGVATLGSNTGSKETAVSTAANTFTGKIVVNGGGVLGITGDGALGAVPSSFTADSIQLGAGSTLTNMTGATGGTSFGNGFDVTLDANRGITLLTNGGKIRVGYNKTFVVNGAITGAGSFAKSDNGTLVLNAANTYTGATAVEAGILKVSSLNSVVGGSASSSLGAPVTELNGTIKLGSSGNLGTLSYTGTGETTDRVIDLAGTTGGAGIEQAGEGLLKFTEDFTANGVGSKGLILSGSTSGTGEISGAIVDGAGTTGVTKNGTGTWTLSGANTYTGITTLSGGILEFSNIGDTTAGGNLGKTGVIAFNGGTLRYTGATTSTTRNMTLNGTGGTFEITEANTNFTITGTVSGGATTRLLTKTGPGTLTSAGSSDNTNGRFIVNAGTLVLDKASTSAIHATGSQGNADYALVVNDGGTARLAGTGGDQIFANSSVRVNSGGTFDLNGRNEGFATLSDDGTGGLVTNTAASTTSTLTLGENSGSSASIENYTFSGVIENGAGTVALTKVGTGTQILSGINTYTGATTVNGGTLLVYGSISGSAVAVNTGGTLGGSGRVGAATVNAGGTLAPGFAVLIAGNTTFDGGTFALEISGTTPGSGYSQLSTEGTFTLSANTPLTINLGAFDPVDGVDTFTIVNNNLAGAVNTAAGLFSFGETALGEGALFTVGTQAFTITYAGGDGNDVVLAAVPEPSVAMSLMGGIGLLLGFRRRKS